MRAAPARPSVRRMLRRLRSETAGQTAAEYAGVLLVVAAFVMALASSGVPGRVSDGLERAVCSIGGGCETPAAARPAVAVRTEGAGRPARAVRDDVLHPGEDELVGDHEDGGTATGGEPGARAAFIGVIKKGACKLPGIKQICKWTFGRLEQEAVKACTQSVAACRALIDKVCKVSRKACQLTQDLSCLALDVLCKRKVAAGPRLVRPFVGQRHRILDELDRASTRFGKARTKGRILIESRDVRSPDPAAAAREAFRRLTRGPHVSEISRTTTQWTVRTPEGRVIRLRRPEASSTKTWTVDVEGGARHVKYKFLP